jgi:hypothetical protein
VSDVLLASSLGFSSPVAVFALLASCVILLSLRAWGAATSVVLTPRVALLLDGAIAVIFVLFIVLVVVRFKTLA